MMPKIWKNQLPFPVPCRASWSPHISAQGCDRACGSQNSKLVCISVVISSTYCVLFPLVPFSQPDTPNSLIFSPKSKLWPYLQLHRKQFIASCIKRSVPEDASPL